MNAKVEARNLEKYGSEKKCTDVEDFSWQNKELVNTALIKFQPKLIILTKISLSSEKR